MNASDEFAHPCPVEANPNYWCETMWFGFFDRSANVFGVFYAILVAGRAARVQACFNIDGSVQYYCNVVPFGPPSGTILFDDGRLALEVLRPLERIKIAFKGQRLEANLWFDARFRAYDWAEAPQENPLRALAESIGHLGGHFEQAMLCRGSVRITDGPLKGEQRSINCLAYRDRSWSQRFSTAPPWSTEQQAPSRFYWAGLQLPARHIQLVASPSGTFIGSGAILEENSTKFLTRATATLKTTPNDRKREDWHLDHFVIELMNAEAEKLTVRTTRHYATVRTNHVSLDNLGEALFEDIIAVVDFRVEETAEEGYGFIDYGIPPRRWLVGSE